MNTPFGSVKNGYETTNLTDQLPVSEGHTHVIADVTGLSEALALKINLTEKGAQNGVATLDENGHVPPEQLGSINAIFGLQVPASANLTANDAGKVLMLNGEGKAEVYQTSPAVQGVKGSFTIEVNSIAAASGRGNFAEYIFPVNQGYPLPYILELKVKDKAYKLGVNAEGQQGGGQVQYSTDPYQLANNIKQVFEEMQMYSYNGITIFQFEVLADSSLKVSFHPSNPLGIIPSASNAAMFGLRMASGAIMFQNNFSGGSNGNASGSEIKLFLDTDGDEFYIYQNAWRNNRIPTSNTEEASYIEEFLLSENNFRNRWRVFREDNVIQIEENKIQRTKISIIGSSTFATVTEVTESIVPIPEMPTKIPLGKLVSLSADGLTATVSNGAIERYQATGPITIPKPLLDFSQFYNVSLEFENGREEGMQRIGEILKLIILPTNGGLVKAFNVNTDINVSLPEYVKQFTKIFRHAILGIAMYDTYEDNTIVVHNSQLLSFWLLTALKVIEQNNIMERYVIIEYIAPGVVIETPNNKQDNGKNQNNGSGTNYKYPTYTNYSEPVATAATPASTAASMIDPSLGNGPTTPVM